MLKNILGIVLFFMSILSWLFLYIAANSTLQYYKPTSHYGLYDKLHKCSVAISIVSALQSLLSSAVGITIVLTCYGDLTHATHPLAHWYAWVAMSYYMYDIWTMYQMECIQMCLSKASLSPCIQHFLYYSGVKMTYNLVMVIVLFLIIFYRWGVGDFFVGCFYCFKFSAIFTNFQNIIINLGFKNKRLSRINMVLSILMFALCRVAMFPFMYWCHGLQYQHREELEDESAVEYQQLQLFTYTQDQFIKLSANTVSKEFSGGWQTVLDKLLKSWLEFINAVISPIYLSVMSVPVYLNVACTVILLLQLYWLCIMVRASMKALIGQGRYLGGWMDRKAI